MLDREAQAGFGMDHERAGELVLGVEPEAWFTYWKLSTCLDQLDSFRGL